MRVYDLVVLFNFWYITLFLNHRYVHIMETTKHSQWYYDLTNVYMADTVKNLYSLGNRLFVCNIGVSGSIM